MNTIKLVCWEKATPAHHPPEYEFVLLHCVEDPYPYPDVVEGYWTNADVVEGYWANAAEGYFSLLDGSGEMVKVDYWAKLPGGPCERN